MARTATTRTIDGNEAVASVAHRMSEVVVLYPISPASPMGEFADDWSTSGRTNLWGGVPEIVEMQSEGGAAGAVHGALQGGALTTTFTASQGLLLMLPNLFKIAGELNPFCMHVAARSVATHALSIFGDHSDVMAARGTGFAMLSSASVQEAHDFAAIGHAVTLATRIPVLHFFDGFRTSHEIGKIETLSDEVLRELIDPADLIAFRQRRLTPDRPVIRGTSQNPDAFFQSREAANPFYDAFEHKFEAILRKFRELTGRAYAPFEYHGDPEAENVIVLMGSGAECAQETVDILASRGEKVGILKVRLFRPYSVDNFLAALPKSVRNVAVLDRTKEPGSAGEPLLLEISGAFMHAFATGRLAQVPRLIGGRYGLSSKEFTPAMVKAVFDELRNERPKPRFTVGIRDDVTNLSLEVSPGFHGASDETFQAVFYGLGSDGTVSSNKATLKIIGQETDRFVQGHFVYDSKKSGSTTVSHLRFSSLPIRSTYSVSRADFIAVHHASLWEKRDVLQAAKPGATVLLNSSTSREKLWESLPFEMQAELIEKRCRLFAIDADRIAEESGLGQRINTVMQVGFFALTSFMKLEDALDHVKNSIEETWGKRGPEVVRRNVNAVSAALAGLVEIPVPDLATSSTHRRLAVPADAPDFVQRVTRLLIEGHGDQLPVSAFPPDGTWPTGTGRFEKRAIATEIPIWVPELCVQCNHCVMICPHAAIRAKVFDPKSIDHQALDLPAIPEEFTPEFEGLDFTLQVAPDDCTGCGLCVSVCPAKDRTAPRNKAINMSPAHEHRERERRRFTNFESIPDLPRSRIPNESRNLAILPPLFEFSGACAGCGETPYIRLLTQLFGDRLMIANATGCSSIYGGNLPTTPYTTDRHGRGPAWNNSLFEDAAELGLGFRLSQDGLRRHALNLLDSIADALPESLVAALRTDCAADDAQAVETRRERIAELTRILATNERPVARELAQIADVLVPRSVWVIGGDGWAYDIGYGGLDHVLASGKNVKMLVLDTEVYSNTGGQQSKATPLGAVAKFASAGKATRKKDLGLLAMSYGHVYVASIAMQARSEQSFHALREAESYAGPALIIAHSPCIAHGYDLLHSPQHQKAAIESWSWPLYRFDPRRIDEGKPPLQLDSPQKRIPMRKYMDDEARFRMVQLRDPERYEQLVRAAEHGAIERLSLYHQLAGIAFTPDSEENAP